LGNGFQVEEHRADPTGVSAESAEFGTLFFSAEAPKVIVTYFDSLEVEFATDSVLAIGCEMSTLSAGRKNQRWNGLGTAGANPFPPLDQKIAPSEPLTA
jgi:hypothetical protein